MVRECSITVETLGKNLSANGGLLFLKGLLARLGSWEKISSILPKGKRLTGLDPLQKLETLTLGIASGADCLEDFDELKHDAFFKYLPSDFSSSTFRRYLQSFTLRGYELLQEKLLELGYELRKKSYPLSKDFLLIMDSTDHLQYGKKMEGVSKNYKGENSLSSLLAFDQYGYCYGFDLRAGGTYSSNGSERMIHSIFSKVEKDQKRYFLGDSAFAKLSIYNELINQKASFVIGGKDNIADPLLKKYGASIKWRRSKVTYKDYAEAEVGCCAYPLQGLSERNYLRVVFIRSRKKDNPTEYDYHSLITNMGQHEMSDDNVLKFYRKRSNMENNIKDMKYGLDFKHFKFQKLKSNKIWGVILTFAYNLLRFSSHLTYPQHGCFIKKTRNRLIKMACIVIKHARTIKLKFSQHIHEEVQRHLKKINTAFNCIAIRHSS